MSAPGGDDPSLQSSSLPETDPPTLEAVSVSSSGQDTDSSGKTDGSNAWTAQTRSERLFLWWAHHQSAQWILLVMLSALAGSGYMWPQWTTRWWRASPMEPSMVVLTHPVVLVANSQQSGDSSTRRPSPPKPFRVAEGECILVAIADADGTAGIFEPANLKAIDRVAMRLKQLPQVDSVLWLDEIPTFNVFGLSGQMLPSENASQRQIDLSRRRVLENPLAVGQLISADSKTLVFHITLDWSAVMDDSMVTDELTAAARQAADEVDGAQLRFLLTGRLPIDQMMAQRHVSNSLKYQAIGYSIMMIAALVLFRGLAAVTIVALAPAIGVFWTMGCLRLTEFSDNPFNDIIVPVMISMVGLADAVHLMVEIRKQRANGLSSADAACFGIARVGTACLLTSITTVIGFISLQLAEHEVVQEFGWSCTIGVAMTFLSVLTVVPLGCSSVIGRRLHVGVGRSLIDVRLQRIGHWVDWTLRRYRPVSVAAIIATIVLAGMTLRLTPDERRYSGLSEAGEAARGLRHLDRVFGGLEFASIMMGWAPDTEESDVLGVLSDVDALLQNDPLLGHPIGLHQLLAALPGDGDAAERMSLLELMPPSLKRAYYLPEYQQAAVQFRIQDRGIAAYDESFTRVESGLNELQQQHPQFELWLNGSAIWRWRNQFQVVRDLKASAGTAIFVIWLVLTIYFRSIRLGLISLVPNIFPLASTGAILVVAGQHLEMVTVCMFTICVGIAVDDTIHFLTRYVDESRSEGNHEQVIGRAITGVGTALMMTTIVLVAGLASAVMGDSRDARLFGLMGCMTLISALAADLFLLPALLRRFDGRVKL
ncbi:MAG: efflux RND transporter permease subunit [Planctomycetota bacterium]